MRSVAGIVVFAVSLAGACTRVSAPDLQRLYALRAETASPPPLVLVHGFMGAELHDAAGRRRWPSSGTTDELRLEIDPVTLLARPSPLLADRLADRAAELSLDRQILTALEQAGGYLRREPGMPVTPGGRHYYVFVYDWRQDNVVTARALNRFLAQIRTDHGDPDLAVDVVAHGIGGLIVRYYMRYGALDVLDANEFPVNYAGDRYLRRIVLLGVPNLGAVAAVQGFVEGRETRHGRITPELFLTWPSAYQALPHPISGWVVDHTGRSLGYDMFDVQAWRDLRIGVFDPRNRTAISDRYDDPAEATAYLQTLESYFHKHLERARRFVWSLTVPAERLVERLIVLGGTCQLTPARVLIEETDGIARLRMFPGDIAAPVAGVDYESLMLEPGDGTITKSSLLARQALNPAVRRHMYSYFPLRHALFMCERHDRLTGNVHFQNNLLNILLSTDL